MDIPVDRSVIKVTIVAVITAALGFVFGYVANQWFAGDSYFLFSVSMSIAFLTALLLQSFFIHSAALLSALVVAQGIMMIIALFWGATLSPTVLGIMVITLAFMIWSSRQGQSYVLRVLSVSIRELGTAMIPLLITALALVGTVRYIGVNSSSDFNVSEKTVLGLLKPGEAAIRFLSPSFSFEMPLGSFVRENADLLVRQQLGILPDAARRELVASAEQQLLQVVNDTLNVVATSQTTMAAIIQQAMNKQLQKIPATWRSWIWIAFGALVFLTIKGFGALLGMVVIWFSWAVYKFLLLVGFIRIGYEEKQKEIVIL